MLLEIWGLFIIAAYPIWSLLAHTSFVDFLSHPLALMVLFCCFRYFSLEKEWYTLRDSRSLFTSIVKNIFQLICDQCAVSISLVVGLMILSEIQNSTSWRILQITGSIVLFGYVWWTFKRSMLFGMKAFPLSCNCYSGQSIADSPKYLLRILEFEN